MKQLLSIITTTLLLIASPVYALGLLAPAGQTGLLNPGLIYLDGTYISPTNPAWDFEAPDLTPGCLELDAQGHFASTGANCSSGNASTSPGGITGQVQLNGYGSFVGSSNFTYATTTDILSVIHLLTTGSTTLQSFTSINHLALGSTTLQNFTSTNGTTTGLAISSIANNSIVKTAPGSGGGLIAAVASTDFADPATTITIAGTSNQITSSAGAQSLATNRTWTLSLPSPFHIGVASTTVLDAGNAFFGQSATSSFNGAGALFVVGSTTLQKFTAQEGTTTSFATTNFMLNGSTFIAPIATTTASLGGGLLTAGNCASVQATTTQTLTTAMAVVVTPTTYPGDGSDWKATIGPNNTVVVRVCALVTVTPTATTYNVRVIP